MAWVDQPTAILALRTHLSDGPTDKIAFQKKLLGKQDGTNVTFRTFEFRRVTNFSTAVAPLGIYKDGVLQSVASTVATDYPDSGDVTLKAGVAGTVAITASYYYQWFIDSELSEFLTNAVRWLGGFTDFSQATDDQIPAVLQYAQFDAFQKLSTKFTIRASSVFMLEEAPRKEALENAKTFADIAANMQKMAYKTRDDLYDMRKGQARAPLFNTVLGAVRPVTPRR